MSGDLLTPGYGLAMADLTDEQRTRLSQLVARIEAERADADRLRVDRNAVLRDLYRRGLRPLTIAEHVPGTPAGPVAREVVARWVGKDVDHEPWRDPDDLDRSVIRRVSTAALHGDAAVEDAVRDRNTYLRELHRVHDVGTTALGRGVGLDRKRVGYIVGALRSP